MVETFSDKKNHLKRRLIFAWAYFRESPTLRIFAWTYFRESRVREENTFSVSLHFTMNVSKVLNSQLLGEDLMSTGMFGNPT